MSKAEDKAMDGPHRYILFDPMTGMVMRAERAQHFAVPLDVVDAGTQAIADWCKAHPKK